MPQMAVKNSVAAARSYKDRPSFSITGRGGACGTANAGIPVAPARRRSTGHTHARSARGARSAWHCPSVNMRADRAERDRGEYGCCGAACSCRLVNGRMGTLLAPVFWPDALAGCSRPRRADDRAVAAPPARVVWVIIGEWSYVEVAQGNENPTGIMQVRREHVALLGAEEPASSRRSKQRRHLSHESGVQRYQPASDASRTRR
jgi:hypothetical protein